MSIQTHAFSILSNIAIYTATDAEPLENVYKTMKEMEETGTPVLELPGKTNDEIRAYFKEVLPEHDESQVYVSDIKKLIKWYNILKEKDMLNFEEKEEEAAEETVNEDEKTENK